MAKKSDDINHAHIRGKVARDPRRGEGAKGAYCFLSVATGNGKFTEYHEISAFGEKAEEMRDVRKGDVIEVEGRINHRKSEKYGIQTSIVVDSVRHFLAEIPQEEDEISDQDIPF